MKKILLLLCLLLCSCTYETKVVPANKKLVNYYENVYYGYNYQECYYEVYHKETEKEWVVPVENTYYVYHRYGLQEYNSRLNEYDDNTTILIIVKVA